MGKELTFDYALLPHSGDWTEAGIYRDGLEFTNPLSAYAAASHAGWLPARWGFLDISNPTVVVSAMKTGERGTAVLRVYEATGRPARGVKLSFSVQLVSAEEVNLMEEPIRELLVADSSLHLDLHPYGVKTVRLSYAQIR